MSVTLQVTSGPSTGRKIQVTRGQIAKIGRTEWADFSFPDDAAMAETHFEIDAQGSERLIRDCSGGIGTLVNKEPVTETRLHTGDLITAGKTELSVSIEGESEPVPLVSEAVSEISAPKLDGPPMATDYCRPLKLSDAAKALLKEGMMPTDYLNLVTENELYLDAIRFLAFWLPRPTSVSWACDCVEEIFSGRLTPKDQKALEAARTWSTEPNQANCRIAEKMATETDFRGASSWLALAAFWSGDSLVPAELQPVPPGEGLTAEAITGSLTLAATIDQPAQVLERYRKFLAAGRQRIPADQ